MPPRNEPPLIVIPPGTPARNCSGKDCGKVFYWAPHPKTLRNHPVSIDHPRGKAPTETEPGAGVSHYSNCPNANDFRTPRTTTVR